MCLPRTKIVVFSIPQCFAFNVPKTARSKGTIAHVHILISADLSADSNSLLERFIVSQLIHLHFDVSVPCLYVYLHRRSRSEDCDPVFISRGLLAVLISKKRLFLPGLRVESHEAVTLHFDPTHLLADVGPPLALEKGSSA